MHGVVSSHFQQIGADRTTLGAAPCERPASQHLASTAVHSSPSLTTVKLIPHKNLSYTTWIVLTVERRCCCLYNDYDRNHTDLLSAYFCRHPVSSLATMHVPDTRGNGMVSRSGSDRLHCSAIQPQSRTKRRGPGTRR